MTEVDELDINPFFIALQTKFASIYQKAEEYCHLICIPKAECLKGANITQKFVNTHVLRPSPFFKGHYMTLLSDKQNVSFDIKGENLITEEGFPTRAKIKVISEELCYNKEYKPYKILIIDRPLDLNLLRKVNTDDKTQSGEFKLKFSQKECREVLQSYPEFSKYIQDLDGHVQKFNHNYILLPDYLEDAMDRLLNLYETTSESCIVSVKNKAIVSHQFKDYIRCTLETYLMASVHQKLYPVICERCRRDDMALLTKVHSLHGLTPDQLSIPEYFCCPLPSAVVELALLDSLVTPIEKFYCLKSTFNNITEEINMSVRASMPSGVATEDVPCLTSDDLIPILVTVIVQAKCKHIYSDIFYMENFYWSEGTKDRDNLSYCLVTFKAAVQFMMSTDFSDIDLNSKFNENGVNSKDSMKCKKDTVFKSERKKDSREEALSQTRIGSKSRIDRQIENISKMLEEVSTENEEKQRQLNKPAYQSLFGGSSSTSKSPVPSTSAPKKEESKKTEDMGDFLSSLQDNMFTLYGKQT